MNKIKFACKRSLAMLLAVLLLLSLADVIVLSTYADNTQTDDMSIYTITTSGINFNENSGDLVYSIKHKVPIYTYSETTGTDNKSYVQISVSYEWQNAVLTKNHDSDVWEMQSETADSAGLKAVQPEKIHLKNEENITAYDYAVISSKEDENGSICEMRILIKENGEWKKVTVQKSDETDGTEYDIWKIKNEPHSSGTDIFASHSDVIQIKTDESEIQVILSGETSNHSELLFMPYEGELDSVADFKAVSLNDSSESSKTANFVVQAPEHKSTVMKKIWQDNGAQKSSDLIAVGVKYYLTDNSGNTILDSNGKAVTKTLINAEIAVKDPDTGEIKPQVNNYEQASLTRYKNINNLEWCYTFDSAYLYDENGNKRQFYLYETETPDGYIQKLNSDGHLVNIKKVEYKASIKWNDGNDSYNTRPTPEEWFDKILYETVTNEQGETEKIYNPSVYKKSDGTPNEQLNPVLLYKIGYQPLKKDITLIPYRIMEESEYKTAEEIEEYNNEIANQNHTVNTANGNDNSGITGYNKQTENTNQTNGVSQDSIHSTAYLYGLSSTEQTEYDRAVSEYKTAVEYYETALNAYQKALSDYNGSQGEETVRDVEPLNEAISAYNTAVVAYNQKTEVYNTFVSAYNQK